MNLLRGLLLIWLSALALRGGELRILCYHDVVATDAQAQAIPYAVSTPRLARHFAWLRSHGYRVVTLDQVLAARNGGSALPDQAVLLTFDDGYRSHYQRVWPLLKAFQYPALFALVGSWMDLPVGAPVPYDGGQYQRTDLLTWEQAREMAASPLVEFASHSFDYHRGLQANPQGNLIQAFIARRYDPATARYESTEQRTARMLEDLTRSRALLEQRLGKAPRALVWPFGRYSEAAVACARQAGFTMVFNLDPGPNGDQTPLDHLRRTLLVGNPDEDALASEFQPLPRRPLRAIHVDLDYVYDPDPAQQERNLDLLVERVSQAGASAVFLQAFADPAGEGLARSLYFPNRHLPMRADLFSHAAWQLHTRAAVAVYAWMPVLSFQLPPGHPAAGDLVQARQPQAKAYRRLTPFSARARQAIQDLYEDLAAHCSFDGLLFHDDATFAPDEDSSPFAAQALAGQGNRAAAQARQLTAFTLALADRVRPWQPGLRTARNIYAPVVLLGDGAAAFGQTLGDCLDSYDTTAVMAFPFMEGVRHPLTWLAELVTRTAACRKDALTRTMFEVQARDWRTGKAVPSQVLAEQLRSLQDAGAIQLGYYPEDSQHQHPDLGVIGPWFSLRRTPRPGGAK